MCTLIFPVGLQQSAECQISTVKVTEVVWDAKWLMSYIAEEDVISISPGFGSKAIHQTTNKKKMLWDQGGMRQCPLGAQPAPVQRHHLKVRALNILIKINAQIWQADGMFGTVYNILTVNNIGSGKCVAIKVKGLMERGV